MARPERVPPGPGQESVWDYPRPPRIEPSRRPVRVAFAGETLAASDRALRVLETAGPPTYYVPLDDVTPDVLVPVEGHTTVCEWKGVARYFDVVAGGRRARLAAWSYPSPSPGYEGLAGYVSFYPRRVECFLGDERVRPQPGGYYGGWITSEIVGPFKGEAGTEGW
ncbi:MAG TPA: DUF427 domain-containing protein [Actinomycetota bacterium]|nr:DUF427 domain-containing protein [Actinomycetota bacterium]